MAVPNNGTHNTPAERIKFSEDGVWEFPVGSVIIKHFDYPVDDRNPAVTRKVETRFSIMGSNGQFYYLTYKWRADQGDADLIDMGTGDSAPITVATNGGGSRTVNWRYPSTNECLNCHNEASKGTLGPRTRYLNHDYDYSGHVPGGQTGNQLVTLSYLGILDEDIADTDTPDFLTHTSIDDTSASLEDRARSYLDLNCAYCHQPANDLRTEFDLRLFNTLEQTGLLTAGINEPVEAMGPDQRILYPGFPDRSQIYHRANSVQPGIMMPPLAKGLVDAKGVALLREWIQQMNPQVTPEAENPPDADVNLALLPETALSGTVVSGRGTPRSILYDPVIDDYVVRTNYNEYGESYKVNLGRPGVDSGFRWQVDWDTPKNVNYITFGGTYPNQPQPNTMWRISYLRNGNWMVIEEGRGGWIDSGIYEWGGPERAPIVVEALRVQLYSNGNSDLVSIHLRGRGGLSNKMDDRSSTTKATLIQYLPSDENVDTEPPVITLTGEAIVNLTVGDDYIEQGATATDNFDGSFAATVGGDVVDTGVAATYTVTYNASDSAGNPATEVIRTVIVSDGTTYSLTVDNGSGDGSYVSGQVVNIVADAAPSGQRFEAWTGDIAFVGSVNSSSTTVTMPSSDVEVTATYGPAPSGGSIWFEDFEDLSNGTTVDNGSTAWGSSRNGGTFQVLDGRFWTNGTGPAGTWTSEVIPISGTVSVSLDVDDSDQKKEPSDYLRAFYILDGGTRVEFGSVSGDIDPQTFMVGGLVGSSIQIVVESRVSGAPENYYIDNVAVMGGSTGGTTYSLTVDNGSGDGSYVSGQVVNIVADAAPSGQRFEAWTGDIAFVGSVNSSSTTVTMPSSDVEVTATYGPAPSGGSIWFEDFEDLSNGTTVDNGSTAWGSSRNGGTFQVLDGRFWTNGTGPAGTWTSEVIPISGTVSVSLDVDDSDQKKEPSDYLRAFYILDGGTRVEFGSVSGDIDPQTFMVGGLVGSSIQIVVESRVSGAPENYYIDNVAVYPTSGLITAKTSIKPDSNMSVYPNPANIETSISFDSPTRIGTIQIYDVTSRLIRIIEGGQINSTGRPINIQELPAGVYYVKAIDDNTGKNYSSRILIER